VSGSAAAGAQGLIPAGLDATVAFVRHGESEWITRGLFQGQGDSPLSPLGRRQAALVAHRLANASTPPVLPVPHRMPSQIVHSPLSRAAETAATIAAALAASGPEPDAGPDASVDGVRLRPDPGFLEIGQGEWEGLPGAEISRRWGDLLRGWREDPLAHWAPGGESMREVDVRVRPAISRLLGELAAEAPAGGRGRSPVLGYRDDPGDEPWAIVVGHDGVFKVILLALLELPLERFWLLPFALCGITVVEIRGGRPRLRLHNATDHLAELETEATRAETESRAETGAL
jgi:broad specificity phosphatase PhoE